MFFTLLQIVREGEAIWTGKRTSQVSRWLLAAQMFDYLTSKTKSVRIAHFSFTNFPVFSIKLINFLIKDFSFIIGIYFTAIFVGGKFKFLFLVGNSKFTTCWTHVQQQYYHLKCNTSTADGTHVCFHLVNSQSPLFGLEKSSPLFNNLSFY